MIFSSLFWCVFSIVFGCLGLSISFKGNSIILWSIWCVFLLIGLAYLRCKGFIFILCVLLSATYASWRIHLSTPESIPPREIRATLVIERIFRSFNNEKTSGIGYVGSVQGDHLNFLRSRSVYFLFPLTGDKVLERGQKWDVTGILTNISEVFPLHKFDYFLWTNDICYKINRVRTVKPYNTQNNSLFFLFNKHCERILSKGIDKDTEAAHIYKAMLLGRKEYLSPASFNDFMLTGTLHLFAVSGLHVGVIAIVVFGFLKLFPFSRPLRLLCSLLAVGAYVFVVGNSPSTIRAFVMIATWVFAQLFYRQVRIEGTLLIAIFLVLLWNPKQLFDVGFQLSYGIVSALIWFGVPLSTRLQPLVATPKYISQNYLSLIQKCNLRFRRWVVNAFSISLAAAVLSQILMAYYWQYITPWALILNIFVIPLASFAVALGSCALLAGSLLPWFPLFGVFNWLALKSIQCLSFILSKAAMLPGATIAFRLSLPVAMLCLGIFYFVSIRFASTQTNRN